MRIRLPLATALAVTIVLGAGCTQRHPNVPDGGNEFCNGTVVDKKILYDVQNARDKYVLVVDTLGKGVYNDQVSEDEYKRTDVRDKRTIRC
jgi:hypothetical protein